jgi:hypothetical protein
MNVFRLAADAFTPALPSHPYRKNKFAANLFVSILPTR